MATRISIDLEDRLGLMDTPNSTLTTGDAHHVLNEIQAFLDRADQSLDELDENPAILSTAIIRGCQDLADVVHEVSNALEQQSHEERRTMAQACLQEIQACQQNAHQQLLLFGEEEDILRDGNNEGEEDRLVLSIPDSDELQLQLSQMDENDMIRVIDAGKNFLQDVEASLRMIDQNMAEELADVALTVARLFVSSLQSLRRQVTAEDLTHLASGGGLPDPRRRPNQGHSMDIEILPDDYEEEEEDAKKSKQGKKERHRHRSRDRVRVLWPPVGPGVGNSLKWAHHEASKRPILSVALGIALWPAAIMTAMIGTPLVLADRLLQDVYRQFQEAPLIVTLERGAAHVQYSIKLAWVSGRLVGKQTLYVLKKQIERHGGVGQITQNCLGMAVDRALHPVETIQATWGGLVWGVDQIRGLVQALQDQQKERHIQELQVL